MKKKSLILVIATLCLIFLVLFFYNNSQTSDQEELMFLGGALYPSTCEWANDSQHEPLGFTSKGFTEGGIMVNYPKVSKVVSFVITPDDALLKEGYIVAGSQVGLEATLFYVGRQLNIYGEANYSNGQWSVNYKPDKTVYFDDIGGGILKVHHSDDAGTIPVMLTGRGDSYVPKVGGIGPDYFEVIFFNQQGKQVTQFDSKCNFLFSRSGYKVVDASTENFPVNGNFWLQGIMLK